MILLNGWSISLLQCGSKASSTFELRAELGVASGCLAQDGGGGCGAWHARLCECGGGAHCDGSQGGAHGPEEDICVTAEFTAVVDGLVDKSAVVPGVVGSHCFIQAAQNVGRSFYRTSGCAR